ncbi:fatty acid desaturase [Caballeronia sp. dw_19]|uniref:fatty acid desaturase n=1 Tax=Caballeronia sp. dw_19 TaxID=2719791 RepID=UPI001BD377DC|nr:fatty acid desaturase [Caballeronia sp. dw_19]
MTTDGLNANRLGSEEWPLTGGAMVPKKSLKALRERSNVPGLLHLAAHLGTLLFTGCLIYLSLGTLWVIPATVLHGAIIVLLFAPLHECSHGTAFRSRWLNTAVGMFAAVVSMRPFLYFKYRHTAHHTYTQHERLDPDIVPFPSTLREYVLLILGASFWPKMVGTYWRGLTGRFTTVERSFIPQSDVSRVRREIVLTLALYLVVAAVSIALHSWAVVIYWLLPRFFGEPVLRAIRMAEHTGADESPDLLANTRTTLANPVFRTLYWNMPFHAEHHVASSVPFHALARLHKEMRPHLHCVANGYIEVHSQIIREIMVRRRFARQSSTGGSA